MILAVDPGLVSGVALYMPGLDHFTSGQVEDGLIGFVDYFERYVDGTLPSTVVVEKFTVMDTTAKKTRQYDALYINGYLEARCHTLGIEFVRQQVSGAKTFATNQKLKALGWYNGTSGGHANDATRHLLTLAAKRSWGQPILRRLDT